MMQAIALNELGLSLVRPNGNEKGPLRLRPIPQRNSPDSKGPLTRNKGVLGIAPGTVGNGKRRYRQERFSVDSKSLNRVRGSLDLETCLGLEATADQGGGVDRLSTIGPDRSAVRIRRDEGTQNRL